MRKNRYTEEQIVRILKESESGVKTEEILRKYGIAKNTFYRWRQKFSGMELSDVKRMRQLEEETRRMKQLIADQALEIAALQAVLKKKW